jgi:hypothetical protein
MKQSITGGTMKKILFVAFIALVGLACNKGDQPTSQTEELSAVFKLTDISGQAKTVFRTGEDFYMWYEVVNTSGKKLIFTVGSAPTHEFEIWQSDRKITHQFEGLAFPQFSQKAYLEPMKTFGNRWLAPKSQARDSKTKLAPGTYLARSKGISFSDSVSATHYDEVKVSPVNDIVFIIAE